MGKLGVDIYEFRANIIDCQFGDGEVLLRNGNCE